MNSFPGKIGRTVAESVPWWPQQDEDANLRPNVVTILFDDTGWSDFGCFGSEIATPAIDTVAEQGLRFTNFHVTPMCSPTRASLLTGRNHHSVGMRCLSDSDTGFPNGRGAIRADIPTLADMLRGHGFATYMVGKWHLAPSAECTPSGPYDNWPLNRGFDRFYGFLGGCTDQYAPELIQDNQTIDPPLREGYHLSEDLCDRAIGYLRDHAAFRAKDPFFLNFCFGATHAPIQVARDYVDPYVSLFEKGWDQTREDRLERQKRLGLMPEDTDLVPRNPEVSAWDDLDTDHRALFTRQQSAYAGFLQHADEQIGRLIAELQRLGLYENTIILIMSDNGASPEGRQNGAVDINTNYSGTPEPVPEMIKRIDDIGGPNGPAHYPLGWAMAGNTPFRRYKQFVDLGGMRSPLVFSWPMGMVANGGIRDQFLHAVDIAPTIMDLIGDRRAAQFDGDSFRPVLASGSAPAPRSLQYWEMFGRRAIYAEGWKAISEHEKGDDYAADAWRLYDTRNDASECHDLANSHPEKLQELKDLWWLEAEANDVFPLDDRTLVDIIRFRPPHGLAAQPEVTFYGGQSHLGALSMICGTDRSLELTGHFTALLGTAEGVIASMGNELGGYTLFIKKGRLVFEHGFVGRRHRFEGAISGTARSVCLRLEHGQGASAQITLLADGQKIGEGLLPETASHLSFWGLDIGRDAALPVSQSYTAPFAFPLPLLDKVTLSFLEPVNEETLAEMLEVTE